MHGQHGKNHQEAQTTEEILNANQTTKKKRLQLLQNNYLPLGNNCLTPSIVYNAKVTTTEDPIGKNYIGLTEGPSNNATPNPRYLFGTDTNSTELSKFIWHHEGQCKTDSILTTTAAYSNRSKRCNLCLVKKFFIIKAQIFTLLNMRSELL